MIRTVLGDIPSNALGHAQCHEHLFVADTPAAGRSPALRIDDTALSLRELANYKRAGGVSLVDAQPVCAGRMARELVEASLRTGVHIIAVTGFHKRMFYDARCPLLSMSPEALCALYCAEITTGMLTDSLNGRISAKAGVVKLAFDSAAPDGLWPDWTEAAIEAAKRAGVPLLIHTEPNCDVLDLIDRVLAAGIPAERMIVCHLDRTSRDIGVHRAAAEAGVYLDYDSIHRYKYISMADELSLIRNMLAHGFRNRLLLSLDTTRERLTSYGGEIGLDYILRHFIGEMADAGIDADSIAHLTARNAADALQIY